MKIKVTFEVDCEVLKNFISAMENRNSTPDDGIEKIIRDYISRGGTGGGGKVDPLPGVPREYIELTNKLIMRCKKSRIGTMAQTLLRKFLPSGVATENEIKAMQKIPSRRRADELNMPYGDYSNRKFGLNFPLLVKEGTSDILKAQCWRDPIQIGDETYYICAQWFEQANNNDRIPLENWIMDHLPIWFVNADEEQKKDMENFIEWGI